MEPTTAPGLDNATLGGETTALPAPNSPCGAPAGAGNAEHWLSRALALWMAPPDADVRASISQPATH